MEPFDVTVNQPVVIQNESEVMKADFAAEEASKVRFPKLYCSKCKNFSLQKMVISEYLSNMVCAICIIRKMHHKFKVYLRKQEIFYSDKNILIVHCGNAATTVLLHLLKTSISEKFSNNLTRNIYCLYLDETTDIDIRYPDSNKFLNTIIKESQEFGYKIYIASLLRYFNNHNNYLQTPNEYNKCTNLDKEYFQYFIDKLSDATAKEDLISKLRNNLIISAAKKLNCDVVLFHNFDIDIATQIICNMTLGRGITCLEKNFLNKKKIYLKFLYPMQAISRKEIIIYLQFYNYKIYNYLDEMTLKSVSIQNITRTFIIKLNSTSALTLPTVHKLSKKIISNYLEIFCLNYCRLCHNLQKPIVVSSKKFNAEFAKLFSVFISQVGKISLTSIKLLNGEYIDTIYDTILSEIYVKNINVNQLIIQNSIITICYSCALLLNKFHYLNVTSIISRE